MLTQSLRQLERDGLVRRIVHPTVPPAVDYELTPLGQSLMNLIRGFRDWTNAYYPPCREGQGRIRPENQPFVTQPAKPAFRTVSAQPETGTSRPGPCLRQACFVR